MARVTIKDNGWKALKARLLKQRPSVKVGIFGEAAAARANDAKDATVGEIANAHEYGLGVPQREWLGGTIDANERDIRDGLRRGAEAVIKSKNPNTEVQLLAQTGAHIAGLCKQRISSGISPALSENYLPRKLAKYPGATTPLIASSQMIGSIGSTVEGGPSLVNAQRAVAGRAAKKALGRRRGRA